MSTQKPQHTFKCYDIVRVQFPGKEERFYGIITYVSHHYMKLLTVKTYQRCTNSDDASCAAYEKELRVPEMFPPLVFPHVP